MKKKDGNGFMGIIIAVLIGLFYLLLALTK